jgi:hypothetical protein
MLNDTDPHQIIADLRRQLAEATERAEKAEAAIDAFNQEWVTRGWSRDPDGKWIELGAVRSVAITPDAIPPEVPVSGVADKLNEMEADFVASIEREVRAQRNYDLMTDVAQSNYDEAKADKLALEKRIAALEGALNRIVVTHEAVQKGAPAIISNDAEYWRNFHKQSARAEERDRAIATAAALASVPPIADKAQQKEGFSDE